jgi:tetratricopeptide (TPR) repeat protein
MPACTSLRGDLWLAAARIQDGLGDVEAAERGQRQAISEFARSGHQLKAARALNHLALSLLFQRKPQEAKELAARSVEIRRQHATRIQTALDTLAQAHAMLGELDSADACFLEATALGMATEDLGTVFCALHGLAYTSGMRERSENALRLYYCAEHLLPELSGRYTEPLAPHLVKLVDRLQRGLGPERSQRLRSEGEALEIPAALRLIVN